MGSGYETELSLRLGSGHHGSWADSDSSATSRSGGWFRNTQQNHHQQQQQQQQQQIITMFYNGRMCVCDVTEIQARAIISMAKREMEEKMENKNQLQRKEHYYSSPPQTPSTSSSSPSPSPPALAPQLLNPGLSMKRSLQRFLQKRKTRIDAVSPYGRTAQWQSS